jgi:hypothetical protein
MTPEPKYFAKLEVSKVTKFCVRKDKDTHSKTLFGTSSHEDLFARTGNRAPIEEPIRMMKMAAIRRLGLLPSPPPEPQLMPDIAQ